MGLITGAMNLIFGDRDFGRTVKDVAEVFHVNAEGEAARASAERAAVLAQFAAEFAHPRKGLFDRFVDGLNRLPRPALALGTIGLFVAAMWTPVWFGERMAGIALIPEPLWWLMGAVVSFYFGARHQAKGQEFQRSALETAALAEALRPSAPPAPRAPVPDAQGAPDVTDNAALADWWASRAGE